MRNALFAILSLYGVGCALSQSLMSLGGAVLGLVFWFLILKDLSSGLPRWWALSHTERFAVGSIIGSMLFLFVRWLTGSGFANRDYQALEHLPLMGIPFLPLIWNSNDLMKSRASKVFWTLISIALLASCLRALYEAFYLGEMAISWMKNPIYLAYNLLSPLIVLVVFVTSAAKFEIPKSWSHLLYLGILATSSRMVFALASVILAVLIVPWAYKNISKIGTLAAICLVAALGVSEFIRKPYARERILRIANLANDPSWQGRMTVWRHNFEIIREHPVLGVGPKQNALRSKDRPEWQALWGQDVALYAHSIYLQALAEGGTIGIVLLLGAFVFLGISTPTLTPLLLAIALGGFTENVLTNSKPLHAFLFWSLILGAVSRRSKPYSSPSKPST